MTTVLQEEAGFEPWHSPRSLRRAFLRAAVVGAVALVPLHGEPLIATCAWVLVPAALFEFWCSPHLTSGRAWPRSAVGSFAFAFALAVAAYFQLLYVNEVLASGSMTRGLDFVGRELWSWVDELWEPRGKSIWSTTANHSVEVFYVAQVCALACTIAPIVRRRAHHDEAVIAFGVACLFVPALDWIAYALLHRACWPDKDGSHLGEVSAAVSMISMASSVALGIVSVFATLAMVLLSETVDWLEGRAFPPALTERQAAA